MKANEAYNQIKTQLEKAGVEDAGFEAGVLFEQAAGAFRFAIDAVDDATWRQLQALAARRAAREPLQYIVGRWPFLDLELEVGPGVLIPRPETEEVCLAAAALLEGTSAPCVLDLCAGSGALALGLQSRLPAARVTAVELDAAAYGWLRRNVAAFAAQHPSASLPLAVQADALAFHEETEISTIDLIVSNPPYVSENEYAALQPEVHAEPRVALVAPEDGLVFYRRISRNYFAALKSGGWLVFETGAGQGQAVAGFLAQSGYTAVELRRDLAGHHRIALGQKPR